jgi:dTDP-4-amino-4,6-dideoxygalactose transaminase
MKIPAAKIYFPEEEKKRILENIKEALDSGWLTLGKYNKMFEEQFSGFVGTKHAVAVSSGTGALEIILRTLGVQGSSVIVPTNTFFATPAAVLHAGGKVVLADVEENLCMSLDNIKENVTEDTKGVVIVHIGGMICPEIKEIKSFCEDNEMFLIEDAAHAHGSSLDNQMAGTFGIASGFSFFPTKVMTSAEGGIITTDDPKIAERAVVFRDQGKMGADKNLHSELGYNWRMSEIHAITGLSQLRCLESFIEARRKAAALYDKLLSKIEGVKPLVIPENIKSNYYKYVAFLNKGINRDELKKRLREEYSVSLSGEVYELPCHLQPIFKRMYGFKEGSFPVSEDLCKRQICLPVYATMKEEEARYVCDCLDKALREM